jgi:hypothetical protein
VTAPVGEPVEVIRRVETGTDAYGQTTYDWPEPGETVQALAVAPRTSQEPAEIGRNAVITGITVYLPTGTLIGPYDRLRARSELYDVDGEVGDWRDPFSTERPGLEVAAVRHEG